MANTLAARRVERPTAIVWALVLTMINAVGGVAYAAWPGLEDRGTVLIVSLVAAVLRITPAWFLWNGSRWGAVATVLLNILNVLAAIPVFFALDDVRIVFVNIIYIGLGTLTIGLVLSPPARASWNGRDRVLATERSGDER
jgi:hypothetical protein